MERMRRGLRSVQGKREIKKKSLFRPVNRKRKEGKGEKKVGRWVSCGACLHVRTQGGPGRVGERGPRPGRDLAFFGALQ